MFLFNDAHGSCLLKPAPKEDAHSYTTTLAYFACLCASLDFPEFTALPKPCTLMAFHKGGWKCLEVRRNDANKRVLAPSSDALVTSSDGLHPSSFLLLTGSFLFLVVMQGLHMRTTPLALTKSNARGS